MKRMNINVAQLLKCLVFFICTNSFAQENGETLIDRVLCVVNARPIFHSEIQRKVEVGPTVIVSDYPSDKDAPAYDKALNDAINFELILSASRDLDIEVSDPDLDQEINRFLEEQKLTKDKLLELLKSQGETYESYRSDFRNQLVLRRFQRKVIAPAIKVTDKDIETYFLSQTGTMSSDSVELSFQQIMIQVKNDQPKEIQDVRRNLIQDLASRLKGSLDFKEAAGLYSDEPASAKGNIVTMKAKDLSSTLKAALEPLKPGEIAGPINVGDRYFFFKVTDKKISLNKDYEAKKASLEQELKIIELRAQTNKWLTEQRQRASIRMN